MRVNSSEGVFSKTCRGCGEDKQTDQFGINRALADGLQPKCKPCMVRQREALKDRYRSVAPPDEKTCRECKKLLPATRFSAHNASPDKLQSRCKDCYRTFLLRHRYGVSPARYAEILESQGGRCAICGTGECSTGKAFAVDHDHGCCPTRKSCGKCVRALLCWNCNHTLGVMREDVNVYRKAIEYIETTRSS